MVIKWLKDQLLLYIVKPQHLKLFFYDTKTKKNAKITSQAHDFKNYGDIYNVEIFISELQLNCNSKILNL